MPRAPPSTETQIAIRTQNVTRRFGRVMAVDGVTLNIPRGELFGLLGPNGAGKTTLFRMLSTQLKPTTGRLWVQGLNVVQEPQRVRRIMGIVPQTAAAYEKLTAWENILLFAELYGLRGGAARKRAGELLRIAGLFNRRHDLVATYSGGMRHRLNIVLGIVHDPDVVFFDEPTTGLDPISRKRLWGVIRELRRAGKTLVLTTHYMQEAEELCDRVAILNRGAIVATGNPKAMGKSLEDMFFQCTTSDDAPRNARGQLA